MLILFTVGSACDVCPHNERLHFRPIQPFLAGFRKIST